MVKSIGNKALDQRRMIVRNALNGPNGSALMDFLMEEYVFHETIPGSETSAVASEAEKNLVLRLRRMSME